MSKKKTASIETEAVNLYRLIAGRRSDLAAIQPGDAYAVTRRPPATNGEPI
ncbi:hypothetical protein D3C85_1629380 [compost metagenome]